MPKGCPKRHWTIEEVRALGASTDLETAGAILGIGRALSYRLAKADEFPVRLLRPGSSRIRVPVLELLKVLGDG